MGCSGERSSWPTRGTSFADRLCVIAQVLSILVVNLTMTTYRRTHVHARIHARVRACTRTHTHARARTHTHTHALVHALRARTSSTSRTRIHMCAARMQRCSTARGRWAARRGYNFSMGDLFCTMPRTYALRNRCHNQEQHLPFRQMPRCEAVDVFPKLQLLQHKGQGLLCILRLQGSPRRGHGCQLGQACPMLPDTWRASSPNAC